MKIGCALGGRRLSSAPVTMSPVEPPTRLRILYCDDQQRFRDGFSERHRDRFDVTTLADIGDVVPHLRAADPLPDLLLLDLYHPLEADDLAERTRRASDKLNQLSDYIREVKQVVDEAWSPAAVPILQDLREQFSAGELPVLIFTQRGLLLLDDRDIYEIERCEADWLLKDRRITAATEAIRIEQFVRRARSSAGLSTRDARRVMVVHGRNAKAARAMRSFLESLGLFPIAWEDAIRETRSGSPHNLEAVRAAMSAAQAVIVMMTAEEEAALLAPLAFPGDPGNETQPGGQPRPNVFFEAGLALGIDPARTVLVELGVIRRASDLEGLNVVRLTNDPESRLALRERLRTAGCEIDDKANAWRNSRDGRDFEGCVVGLGAE
jgi:predicted nucleotide-binding protein